MQALTLIAATAEAVGCATARAHPSDALALCVEVRLERADGSVERVRLTVRDHAGALCVREDGERRFPSFCPERHINFDGSFCLGWKERWLYPSTEDEAVTWWHRLRGYLYCQLDAEQIGEWSAPSSWRHGEDAATAQAELERECAENADLLNKLRRLAACGVAVLVPSAECPCGSTRSTEGCHGADAQRLLALARAELDLEAVYWRACPSGVKCCRSMKKCWLSKGSR